MPNGKAAGVACVQLDAALGCKLFGKPERPLVCQSLQPHISMCGDTREQALQILAALEHATAPGP
jgi:uncharacterized protein